MLFRSIYLANSVKNADFNGPQERSSQARYDLDFSALGVPGLNLTARYVGGWLRWLARAGRGRLRIRGSASHRLWPAPLGAGHRPASHGATGAAKGLHMSLAHVSHQGNDAQEKRDIDRLYIILEYPIQGLL